MTETTADIDTDTLVRIRGLRYARGDRMIFDGVDLDIPRGKVTAIMGPSGTGKTTLLRLIGGQLYPHEAASASTDWKCRHCVAASSTICASAWACCSSPAPAHRPQCVR